MNEQDVLQLWKMVAVTLLRKHGGLVRITEAELRGYNSNDAAIACKVVEPGPEMDCFLMTPSEVEEYNADRTRRFNTEAK